MKPSEQNKIENKGNNTSSNPAKSASPSKITSAVEFGRAIRQRRKSLGYTQAFVSEVTGFSTSFLSELENGKETAEIGKAIYLATMLGMDLELKERV